jgi:hypothetical protein
MRGQIWETRPLEFWAKAKELRAGWQKSIESKDLVVGQGNTYFVDWQAAFPAIKIIEDNPAGAMIANKNPPFARNAGWQAKSGAGAARFAATRTTAGAPQFLGCDDNGNPIPPESSSALPMRVRPAIPARAAGQGFFPVPQWMADQTIYFGPYDAERNASMMEHKCLVHPRQINDIERVFGQKFDDEKLVDLIRATSERPRTMPLEISILMATTKPDPPLGQRSVFRVHDRRADQD